MFFSSSSPPLFDKILIANRGEIACRVIQSCQKLGIKTVAVYSEPDVNAVAVRMADEAYCIGPAPSMDSYLSIPNIMQVVKDTGAEAVHPGYGFLSENKEFCLALEEANVKFIGPRHDAIEAMGDKIESKKIAINAGVNTIPGFLGVMHDEDEVIRVANEIGYPVMIKASAGGGGKGMRVAYTDDEAKIGFRMSKDEALSSFGDDRLFIEKFIEDPRHIEIQLIADQHGNVVPFPERECSIQRRNQKVIEEAPSMLLDEETRQAMSAQAVMLAKAVGYESAGTVEFLCDKNKNFYFLEMNTRLQVEHPITELVSQEDLVEHMLNIAAGHRIPKRLLQGPVKIHGWAMESRVYAEDPSRGFLPSIGRLLHYKEPIHYPGVRVDSGVTEGSDISMFYDPMISKLVTHGKDRNECLERMKVALDNYVIRGPGHNVSFLQDVYRHPRFESGKITTKFIEEEYAEGFQGVKLTPIEMDELIASAVVIELIQFQNKNPLNKDSTKKTRSYYVSPYGPFGEAVATSIETSMNISTGMTEYHVTKDDKTWTLSNFKWPYQGPMMHLRINGQEKAVQILKRMPLGFQLLMHGAIHDVIVRTPKERELSKYMQPKPVLDTSKLLQCPMPGLLVSVAVQSGDHVEVGQELAVVEAMKMQNILRAEKKGTIASVNTEVGASLKVDEVILEFE